MNPSGLENWLPIVTFIAGSGILGTLAVAGFRLITQAADHIQDATWRARAQTAVHFAEQTLAGAGPYAKKDAAVRLLTDHGVPANTASNLVESAVSQMRQAAATALVTPAPVVVQVPVVAQPAPAATPPQSILLQLAGELAPLLNPPPAAEPPPADSSPVDTSPPVQDAPPVMGVGKIYLPPGLPAQPPTPTSNGTAGDAPAEPVATVGG